ncbi:site-specific DNA-methyltransferase [Acidovorax sp. JG5]|uniref:site-specific DNA-methyltransferase n=1 Tax=Acidovorax sp. JG5 TaxID=2822718 RepID=UPI001B332B0A|nr:site-specific DNA-methyltransferase [Acidovorax sp. JG5]MBP3979220.1 site-specific DNA-methyltransferase [Acidovorax sp. JG5]
MPTLDWLNRAHAFTTAAQVPYRLLENVSTHGDAASAHNNLLIQGDNLEALKALLPFYRGQVKCIFIDPPYNTKSAFEHYDDNLEHSQWLSMMLPRLQLLRDLLSEDGSIWVTIDDNEGHYLKVLMDEVFGRRNFVANVFWEKKFSPQNDAYQISINHDHVLVYAKRSDNWRPNLLPRSEKQAKNFKNPDNDPRGPWLSADYTCAKTKDERPNLYYAIRNPFTGQDVWPSTTRVWAFERASTEFNLEQGLLYWGANGNNERPRLKKFPDAVQQGTVPTTFWRNDEVGNNQDAKKEILTFDAVAPFATPKPERLIERVLTLATHPNDLVLDSFLGSGTTAAVAHKMGRRWIGIEMGEHAATHCLPRLQKVIDGEQGGISQAVNWQGGGGFRFMRLGAPIFDADGCIHPEVRFATLAAFVWQQETGTAFDPARATPATPGTPHLGTHSVFDSYERLPDGRQEPISPELQPPAPQTPPAQGELGLQVPGALPPPEPVPAPAPVLRSRTAYYLLFNGILGDKRPASGNVLTSAVLDALLVLHASTPHPEAPLVVYGEACRLGEARLALARVTFKHIPYDVKAR